MYAYGHVNHNIYFADRRQLCRLGSFLQHLMGSMITLGSPGFHDRCLYPWGMSHQTLNDLYVFLHLPVNYLCSLLRSSTKARFLLLLPFCNHTHNRAQQNGWMDGWMNESLTPEANVNSVLTQKLVENKNPTVLWTWMNCPGSEWQPASLGLICSYWTSPIWSLPAELGKSQEKCYP